MVVLKWSTPARNRRLAPGGLFAQPQPHKRKQVRSVSTYRVQGQALPSRCLLDIPAISRYV